MKLSLACLAAGAAAAAAASSDLRGALRPRAPAKEADGPNDNFCDLVNGDLPSFCTCTANTNGGTISCVVDVFDQTVNLIASAELCATPGQIEFEIIDNALKVDYTKNISLADNEEFPVRASVRACCNACVCARIVN
jgi:hypothetical protein